MPAPLTINEKPAEVLIPGGLNRVLATTVSPSPGKDEDHEYLHHDGARV